MPCSSGLVVVLAGGVREEVQRAFLLRRFEQWLGGGAVGLVVTSVLFGAGHRIQGLDAAVATGVLGAFWGLVYLRRRSVVAPVVSHAGFESSAARAVPDYRAPEPFPPLPPSCPSRPHFPYQIQRCRPAVSGRQSIPRPARFGAQPMCICSTCCLTSSNDAVRSVSSECVGALAVIAAELVFSGQHHRKSLLVVSANAEILPQRLAQMRLGHAGAGAGRSGTLRRSQSAIAPPSSADSMASHAWLRRRIAIDLGEHRARSIRMDRTARLGSGALPGETRASSRAAITSLCMIR